MWESQPLRTPFKNNDTKSVELQRHIVTEGPEKTRIQVYGTAAHAYT